MTSSDQANNPSDSPGQTSPLAGAKPAVKQSDTAGKIFGKGSTGATIFKQSGIEEAHAGGWVRAFTRLHKVPVFRRVWFYLFVMAVYTLLIDHFLDKNLVYNLAKQSGTVAFSSIVLGILLVFRTETAWESWLDGRLQWGLLVNASRSFCYKLRALPSVPEQERMKLGRYVISFAYALKHHLRETVPSEHLPGLENPERIGNLPMHVADKIFNMLQHWHKEKCISYEIMNQLLDTHMQALTDICGACERVKNSGMAVSYRAFMRQGIVLNLVVCPWLLASEFSVLLSLPMILIGTYFLVGLELIAEDIEEPFGKDLDDIPLDTLCGQIRETITEILSLNKQFKYTQTVEAPLPDLLK